MPCSRVAAQKQADAAGSSFRYRRGAHCIGDPGSNYNGWTWEERVATNPIQRAGKNADLIVQPMACGITGQPSPYVFLHLEDYSRPLDAILPVGRWEHYALHARFTDPVPWQRLVRRTYVHGAWWTFLTMDPTDMFRPLQEVYPCGLPSHGELWPDLADELALSPSAFVTRATEVTPDRPLHAGNLFRSGLPEGRRSQQLGDPAAECLEAHVCAQPQQLPRARED